MKIGLVSDSHDRMPTLHQAIELFVREQVDALIHGGDFVAPFAAMLVATFPGPIHAVFGNNDGEQAGLKAVLPQLIPGPLRIELGGRRILVHHWIRQIPAPLISQADVIVSGHTHEAVVERRDGRLIVNPGECCGWLTGRATVAILETDSLDCRIVTLDEGRSWKP